LVFRRFGITARYEIKCYLKAKTPRKIQK